MTAIKQPLLVTLVSYAPPFPVRKLSIDLFLLTLHHGRFSGDAYKLEGCIPIK